MGESISLKEIFQTLRKRISLIAAITLFFAVISALVTYFLMTPKYDASAQILVNQSDTKQSNLYDTNAVQTNVQLVNTYRDIIKSPAVLHPVIQKLHLDMTAGQLAGMISVSTSQNSQVFSLTAETASPSQSVKIVNGVADSFKSQVQKVMNVDNVSILSSANIQSSMHPVKPKPVINITISLVAGLIAAIGLAFLLEYLDNTIKKEDDIEQVLGLPVLGSVSEMKKLPKDFSQTSAPVADEHRVRGEDRVEAK
ncbi:capsule biosynthesis protein [Sporolactobacillus sp. THM7-7]|nr:capsule biosynthesis protein [Sporolactobacillus sp. THM7-7]